MVTTTTKPTVLIIEDEPGPRNSLKQVLKPFFHILEAENGHQALSTLRAESIDLITLDQKLPDIQGIDLLKNIKAERTDVEVIMITGYGNLQSAMEGMRFGIAGYLLKPFNVNELVSLINQTLDKKSRLDFLRNYIECTEEWWSGGQGLEDTMERIKEQYASLFFKAEQVKFEEAGRPRTVKFLSDILEAHGRDLYSHSNRVSFYATLLGNQLNFIPADQELLALGGLVHDIGYITFSEKWSSHSEESSDPQNAPFKEHPEIGSRLASSLELPTEAHQIISFHHEAYNGDGFPHGLKGAGIPLLAQVIGLADFFDNLRTERPHQPALTIEEALDTMKDLENSRFAPHLLHAFTKIIQTSAPPV